MFHILAWVLAERKFSSNIVDPEGPTIQFLHHFVFNAVAKVVVWRSCTWTCLSVEVILPHWLIDNYYSFDEENDN